MAAGGAGDSTGGVQNGESVTGGGLPLHPPKIQMGVPKEKQCTKESTKTYVM